MHPLKQYRLKCGEQSIPHQRSKQAQQRRTNRRKIRQALKAHVIDNSFRDIFWAETICQTSHVELRDLGYTLFGEQFSCTYIPDVDCGVVLSDSRGRGVFQK